MNEQRINGPPGHAFISYVHADQKRVDRLQGILEAAGIKVWRDTANLSPGQDWKIEIRRAITADSLAFIACFSENSQSRSKSYQNEELILAVEEMRVRPPGQPWLIPVRFAECDLPDFDLGAGRTLNSLQRIDLFGDSWENGGARLVAAVLRILGAPLAGREGKAARRPGLTVSEHPRARGDISVGDIRNWAFCLILGCIAAVSAFFALRSWAPEYSYTGASKPDPHRYICYAVIAIAGIVSVISILEGIISPRLSANQLPPEKLTAAMNRPLLRFLRWLRVAVSLVGGLLVFSGLVGFENFGVLWSFSLAAIGGLALIASVSIAVRHDGDSLLASTLLLLAGTFVPVHIYNNQATLGFTTPPGVFAAIAAIVLGVGWYYYVTPALLAVLILAAIPMIVYGIYNSDAIIGPYVVLVACVSLLIALALGAGRPFGKKPTVE